MSSPVTGSNAAGSANVELQTPEGSAPPAGPPKPTASRSNTTDAWTTEDGAAPGFIEGKLHAEISELEPKEVLQLSAWAELNGLAEGEGKVRVERNEHGGYDVSLSGKAAVRLGLGSAELKWHVGTAAEAADLSEAALVFAAGQATTAANPVVAKAVEVIDPLDAGARMARYRKHLVGLKGELGGQLEVGTDKKRSPDPLVHASAKARVNLRAGFMVDAEKKELSLTTSSALSGKANGKIEWFGKVAGEASANVTVAVVFALDEKTLRGLRDGTLSIDDVSRTLGAPKKVVVRGEVEVVPKGRLLVGTADAKVKVKTELTLPPAEVGSLTPEAAFELLRDAKWSLEAEGGLGPMSSFSTDLVSAEVGVTRRKQFKSTNAVPLPEAIKQAAELHDAEATVALRRATFNP